MITITSDFNQEGFEREVEAKLNSTIDITSKDVRAIAEMAVEDIKEGIDSGEDLNGNAFVPNTKRWIERKGNSTVYKGKTLSLYNSVKVTHSDDKSATISVQGDGLYWQVDPKYPRFKRVFFGFSKRFDSKVLAYLEKNFA